MESNLSFSFADFFCGIGGFHLALSALGGRCVFACDSDEAACKTYAANFGIYPKGDVTKLEGSDVPYADVFCAGFPCQAFSFAGKRKGFEDSRGTLFFEIVRLAAYVRPRVLFMENVKGLLRHNKGETLKYMYDALTRFLGYFPLEPKVLNAKYFGVPQNRERVFILAFREKNDMMRFSWPVYNSENVPAFESVKESPPVDKKYFLSQRYWDSLKKHKERNMLKGNGFGYRIVSDTGVCNAVVCGGMGRESNLVIDKASAQSYSNGINDECVRRLTVREYAALQGFPRDFVVPVADVHAYKQFGNSVAIPVILEIGKKIVSLF